MRSLFFFLFILTLSACRHQNDAQQDEHKPVRAITSYFDTKFFLYQLPDTFYNGKKTEQTFNGLTDSILWNNAVKIKLEPLGHPAKLHLQYTHIYSNNCVYTKDSKWKYAEICFPNSCLTKDTLYALAHVTNNANTAQNFTLRLFYQNTSYWYSTADTAVNPQKQLDNFYGCSRVYEVKLNPGENKIIKLPYSIGLDPKHENEAEPYKVPARAGNYEFALLCDRRKGNSLLADDLNLKEVNPFAVMKLDEGELTGRLAYVGPQHFKFVVHEEFFDGTNDLQLEHVYLTKNDVQKKLCDTCTGWHRKIIDEDWVADDFFNGRIHKSGFVLTDYGNRSSNVHIDSAGVTLTVPASTEEHYQKTWGEMVFGPSFKYGHVTVRAKFADMFNRKGVSNGLIHNLWLYETDPPEKPTGPYKHLTNPNGQQPFEIDMEFWPANNTEGIWDDQFYINCSIIDYMRDENVIMKPGMRKIIDGEDIDRVNNPWQLLIIPHQYPRSFFSNFHTYEIFWTPEQVEYFVDGKRLSHISKEWAKIPDSNMFLWIGTPIYQEGNYYTVSYLPFFDTPKYSYIDYIKIE
ncbi:MAG: glycoside hydrolase family 16 protein [Chitinophagales bacterium]